MYCVVQSYVDLCDVLPSPGRDVMPECCNERQIRIQNRSLAAMSDLASSKTTGKFTGRGSNGTLKYFLRSFWTIGNATHWEITHKNLKFMQEMAKEYYVLLATKNIQSKITNCDLLRWNSSLPATLVVQVDQSAWYVCVCVCLFASVRMITFKTRIICRWQTRMTRCSTANVW